YHLLEASSARALAMLADFDSLPPILDKFRNESHNGLRVTYASALGILQASEATGELFALLRQIEVKTFRGEIGLALARIAGDERYYMQRWHSLHANPATATARAVLALQKLTRQAGCQELTILAGACAESFAHGDLPQGASQLKALLCQLPQTKFDSTLTCIINECAASLAEFGPTRLEFILLSLHVLNIALPQLPSTRNPH
ncbi:MAG TPA: hypothetical protein VEC93_08165, partial [Anaerolineae bacterium]|nr:hypothetical protein [Anaerolineae bacterium]